MSSQRRANLGRWPCVTLVEQDDLEAQVIDQREVVLLSPALERAEIQLVSDERRDTDVDGMKFEPLTTFVANDSLSTNPSAEVSADDPAASKGLPAPQGAGPGLVL